MPRRPTGNPRGRPKGTGRLGEQTRLTVRIPTEISARLALFAEGRSFTRGTPQLAGCVREALEHYLACPHKRQTGNIPVSDNDVNGQTSIVPALPVEPRESQRERISLPIHEQREPDAVSVPARGEPGEDTRQTENSPPAYDASTYMLYRLCPQGHAYGETGQSLVRRDSLLCVVCEELRMLKAKAKAKAQRMTQRKRQA